MNTSNLTVNNNNALSAFFAEQFANLTPWTVGMGLFFGLIVGLIIAFVYKRCYRGVLYSPNFAITLIMMTLITTPVVCVSALTSPFPWAWWARCPSCGSVPR